MIASLKINILGYRIATIDFHIQGDNQATFTKEPPKIFSDYAKALSNRWVRMMTSS